MAKFDNLTVLEKIGLTRIIPVFYHENLLTAEKVLSACYEGGIRVFEFTNRGDFAHEVFSQLVKYAGKHCPEMILGAGSVVDPATASLYIQSGASFIVGPLFNLEVAKACNRRLVPYLPGCASPTEVGFAQEAGCIICKLFPGDVMGPAMVKDILAPMPWSKLMVTGGVSPDRENLQSWFRAGAYCVGMGSNLIQKKLVENEEWDSISSRCCEAVRTAAEF